jgi:hypothetical protein
VTVLPAPDVDPAELEAEPGVEPTEVDTIPANPYLDAPDDAADQDDLEGMGAPGDAPRTPREAQAAFREWHDAGRPIEPMYCLRYTRGWYGVAPLYASAVESLLGAEVKHRITDWSKVPRWVAFYMRGGGSQYGHIGITLGGGMVGTTDWPRGRLGIVSGAQLETSWGYAESYWSPYVNNVRVWTPGKPDAKPEAARQPEPDPTRGDRIDSAIRDLAAARKYAIEHKRDGRAKHISAALRDLRAIDPS